MDKLRVAVIGAGPAGIYASDLIFKAQRDFEVSIDLFDLLPTPYGLVRYGVAPDHPRIKGIVRALFEVLDRGHIRFFGNVQFGRDLTLEDLRVHYHAVIFATGAIRDAELDIPGVNLEGSFGAADFVNWYDAHPDFPTVWPLEARQIAVIGNGNVALDVARMLVKSPEELLTTEIPRHVYEQLSRSPATDVHVFGRRGPAQMKFSPLELREALHVSGVQSIVYSEDMIFDETSAAQIDSNNQTRVMVKTVQELLENPQPSSNRRLHLHFFYSPEEIVGQDGKVCAIRMRRNRFSVGGGIEPTEEFREFPVQAVYRAVGYFGSPVPGVPFDAKTGTIRNVEGRVLDESGQVVPGVYATGWIKRGPVGLIGHTKADAIETIGHLLSDRNTWWQPHLLAEDAISDLLRKRGIRFVNWLDWLRIDAAELAAGEVAGRERVKLFDREQMISIGRG